jgi:pimeloyl-ACP methyl ester carboxylesterase
MPPIKHRSGGVMQRLLGLILLAIAEFVPTATTPASIEQRFQKDIKGTADAAASPKSGYVMVNGIRIHYLEWGRSGPPVILLHGLYDDARTWEAMAPLLASDYHIVAPDRRGAGSSDKPKKGYDSQTLVSDLTLLIRNLKLGPASLVGHSAGAEIALMMAVQRPEMIHSVIMVDGGFWPKRVDGPAAASSAPCKTAPDECARMAALEKASRGYDAEILYPRVTSPILLVLARQASPGADELAEYKRQGIDYLELSRKAEQHAKEVADRKLRRGQITFIENTRHWIQVDQPQSLAQAIRQFLMRQGVTP